MSTQADHLTCPRFGALLYGAHCIGCDCPLASGPDQTAHIRAQRVGDRYEFRVEDVEFLQPDGDEIGRIFEMMGRHRHRMEEVLGVREPWRHTRRSYARPQVEPAEIITDPADTRGLNAKPIGGTYGR
jgi:hypothetical protein